MKLFGKKRSSPLTASILLGGFVFLYLSLFSLSGIPYHFLPGDATNIMFNACRMLRGNVIYRDFFEFTPAGAEAFYFLLFKILGVHTWLPNLVLIGLGLSIAWLMIVISRKVIPGRAAYLAPALFLVIPFRSALDPTHHWFTTLAVMAALALVVENITTRRLLGAGALCGLATCFTQTTGFLAVSGLALYLLWAAATHRIGWPNFRRAQLDIWSSFCLVSVLFNAYFIFKAGLGTFFYDTVVFCLRYWPMAKWNGLGVYMTDMPYFHPWYRLPALAIWLSVYLLTPLIYILFLARYRQQKAERPSEPWDRLVLIAITGTMLFIGVAPAASWLRLCVVAPFGLILFVWFVSTPGRFRSVRVAAVWVAVIVLALGEGGEHELAWQKQVKLPIGRVVVFNHVQYKEIKFLVGRTKPGDYFFGNSELNFLFELRDPSPIPYLTSSGYTRPEQVQQTIQDLKSHPAKYIFWSSNLDMPPEKANTANRLAPLRAYLHSHYQLVKSIEGYDARISFWKKRNAPATAPFSGQVGALRHVGLLARLPRRGSQESPGPLVSAADGVLNYAKRARTDP